MSPDAPQLSVVLPCFNEQESVRATYERLVETLERDGIGRFEILFVENGSRDATGEILREIEGRDSRIAVVRLTRNFGCQGGVHAGLAHARGEWVAVIDCDLQDPPELIRVMLDKAREGYEIVYGHRASRDETLFRRMAFWGFYRVLRSVASIDIPVDAGDFCLMSREVVDALLAMPERNRLLRGLRAWTGYRSVALRYERAARRFGETKFNVWSQVDLAIDAITAFSIVPLRMIGLVGVFTTLVFGALTLTFAARRAAASLGVDLPMRWLPEGLGGWGALSFFLTGCVILFLGIVGEYIARIYEEVRQRPHFLVSKDRPPPEDE